jgi:hypothetical protein
MPVESTVMVAGKTDRELAKLNVLGPIVAGSKGSLKVT